MKTFPVGELAQRGEIEKLSTDKGTVRELLSFFSVASVDAWNTKYASERVAWCHSQSFKSDSASVATWLRLGAKEASKQECESYNATRFKASLRRTRNATRRKFAMARDEAVRQCNLAGVALACIKPFKGTALSDAARWLAPFKALIQLSARHQSDDHFWFTLFHEAAHLLLLLHSKKRVFVDERSGTKSDYEEAANKWAANFLIPAMDWARFVETGVYSRKSVTRFATQQGVARGIVVGRLQHERRLPWSRLNDLKIRLEWVDN